MIRKREVLLIILFGSACVTTAQKDSLRWRLNDHHVKSNVLCGELLGGNLGISINYERVIINKKHFMLNARVGLGNLIVLWSVTYSLSGNFGGKNNFLEIGFGKTDYTLLVPGIHSTGPSSYYYPLLGYRYHKNFLFKCQILALINHKNNELTNTGNGTLLIPGLSFGKTF